jgi:hypothetical protein
LFIRGKPRTKSCFRIPAAANTLPGVPRLVNKIFFFWGMAKEWGFFC